MAEQQKFEEWASIYQMRPAGWTEACWNAWQARAAQDKSAELSAKVLAWWEEHQYDTYSVGEDERNTYDTTPDFVVMAQVISKARGE